MSGFSGLHRSRDDWFQTENEDDYGGSHGGRLAQERYWWVNFHRAKARGKAVEFLADYDGHVLYAVLVEDARRLLTQAADAVGVRK